MYKQLFGVLAAVVLAATFVAGCGKNSSGQLDAIKKAGEISIFTNPTFPPYEFLGKDGAIVGVDIDIAQRVADKLGVKLNVKNAEFDGIIAAIASGKADMGISGFTINEERKQKVDFSVPYVDSVQYLILPEASPIKVLEDLAGKNIGGQQGTTGYLLVEDEINKGVLKDAGVTLKPYNNAPDAVVNLKEGRLAAVVIDELVAQQLAKNNPGYIAIPLKFKSGSPVTEQFGVAIAKGNGALLEVVNEVIKGMLDDGSLKAAFAKYEKMASEVEKK